ncbi:GPAT2 acyltransferase, partial [Upupa epops]|nr:GPAT2 acyltransferase [Upupa epops]
GSGGDSESPPGWKEKVLGILAEIQAPLSPLLLRSVIPLLGMLSPGHLLLQPNVPLVFLSVHKSQLDGVLLAFLLFSQGLGVPRVALGGRPYSPRLRALLSRLGGIFLPSKPSNDSDGGLSGAVLATFVREVLRSQQPLLIFLEEPQVARHLSAAARQWLALVCGAVRDGAIPDALLVPVGIAYDVVP